MKHTPGPWEYIPGEGSAFRPIVQRGVEGGFVVMGLTRCQEESDARLIAASPSLLKSLKMCVTALEMAGVGDSLICNDARAAIAKATGGEHE
jgi:hypothetical protein